MINPGTQTPKTVENEINKFNQNLKVCLQTQQFTINSSFTYFSKESLNMSTSDINTHISSSNRVPDGSPYEHWILFNGFHLRRHTFKFWLNLLISFSTVLVNAFFSKLTGFEMNITCLRRWKPLNKI